MNPLPWIAPPPFSPPDVERRQAWTWVILGLLFAGLIALSLLSYFGVIGGGTREAKGDDGPAPPRFSKEASGLAYWVAIKTIVPAMGQSDSNREIEKIADELKPSTQESPEAARLYAAARYEVGKPVEHLEVLTDSEEVGDRAFAAIYLDASPTIAEARKHSADLDDHGFITTLAKVHALERAGDEGARKRLLPIGTWWGIAGLIGAVLLIACLGLILWLVYGIALSQKKLMPKGFPMPCLTPLDGDRGAARMVLFVLIFVFVGSYAAIALSDLADDATQGVASSLAVAVVFIASLRTRLFGRATSFRQVVGDTHQVGKLIGWGVLGWIATVPVVLLLSFATQALTRFLPEPTHPISDMLPNAGAWQIAMLFMAAAIMAPLLEETAFRGILFPAVSRLVGSVVLGILISSFLFASIHPQGIAGWPPLMGIGAVCAIVTYQTRSLIPAMVLHAIHNGLLVGASLLLL
ncbi:MAG TPA: type II CAAX endopeptidase family protein [Fimbriimonadaceae bacterium]|nr:type II CAAX endopeptidase family protein [Fimbriimonadaceae bacterium]